MYTVEYLNQTQDMPLVLGGDSAVMVHIYFDASHASGPRSRSITQHKQRKSYRLLKVKWMEILQLSRQQIMFQMC